MNETFTNKKKSLHKKITLTDKNSEIDFEN